MQVEDNAMNREQRIQHAMDFLCDIIPWDTPNYEEELRKAAESYIDWEDAGCPGIIDVDEEPSEYDPLDELTQFQF
jgi:hypothetical protein